MGTVAGDSCAIWDFSTPEIEAQRLAAFVAAEMKAHELGPRDFVLLVRQKAVDYAAVLEPAFQAAGISLRNEAGTVGAVMLQELLAEEASDLLVHVLRLAMTKRAGRHWTECQEALGGLRGISPDDEAAQTKFARELDAYTTQLSADRPEPPTSKANARAIVDDVLDFVGRERLIAVHPAYAQGGWFDKVIESATIHLHGSSVNTGNWMQALDAYEGLHAIPLMTIHKSKGLEYHTVIFVGLDDGAWWSFAGDQVEATAGFFVAFTRAKQRVVFTYCARRGARTKIASRTRTVESAAVRVEASRDDAERLSLLLPGADAPVAPTHWSFGQLASLVGAPAAYLRQLPAALAGINLQYGLTSHRAEQVKTLETDEGRVELRAVTGPDYGRIYDHELVAAVQRIAGNGTGDTRWKVPGVLDWSTGIYNPRVDVTQDTTTLYASDRDVFLFLVDDLNPIEAGRLPDGSPDLYFRGFYCWNSEVGAKTLGMASFYLRAVCQNRTVISGASRTSRRSASDTPSTPPTASRTRPRRR